MCRYFSGHVPLAIPYYGYCGGTGTALGVANATELTTSPRCSQAAWNQSHWWSGQGWATGQLPWTQSAIGHLWGRLPGSGGWGAGWESMEHGCWQTLGRVGAVTHLVSGAVLPEFHLILQRQGRLAGGQLEGGIDQQHLLLPG